MIPSAYILIIKQSIISKNLNLIKKLSNNIFDKADSSSLKLNNSYVTVK